MDLLEFLRRRQSASAEAISAELGITPNAVRQHLTNLERDGFVRSEPVRHKRGRPSLLFSLTDRADSVFPKRYGQLATMILTDLQEKDGPEALDALFQRVAHRHVDTIEPELRGLSFDDKITRLVPWPRARRCPRGSRSPSTTAPSGTPPSSSPRAAPSPPT
jgi:predicted ArsR family transcriptional regulator